MRVSSKVIEKAMNGLWYKDPNRKKPVFIHRPYLQKTLTRDYIFVFNLVGYSNDDGYPSYIHYDSVAVKDYGKTWALTKEELK